MSIDKALVARSSEVAVLFAETGRYAKAREDLPGVDREAEALRAGLEMLARRLGLTQASEIKSRQPSDAELAHLRVLCREGRAIEAELARHSAELARERQNQGSLQTELAAAGGAPIDPEPLREELAAVAPTLRRLEQRAEIEPAIEAEAKALAEAGRRLSPPVASLDALAGVSVPGQQTIGRFRKEQDAHAKTLDRAEEEARAAERECRGIEAELENVEGSRAVPSLAAIAAARGERETLWERLRTALFGAALPAPERAASVAAFERQAAHADRLADEALGDAQRVAQHGLLMQQLLESRERSMNAEETLANAERCGREAGEKWRATWAVSGISPLPPAEMAEWSLQISALLDRRADLLARREKLRGAHRGRSRARAELAGGGASSGPRQHRGGAKPRARAAPRGSPPQARGKLGDGAPAKTKIDTYRARANPPELDGSAKEATRRSTEWNRTLARSFAEAWPFCWRGAR